MYIPGQFEVKDTDKLIEAIKEIKIGIMIIYANSQFYSAHIPFLVKKMENRLSLEGHVSAKNEIWKAASPENNVMVIFRGPNAYIHPGWYATKDQTGRVVPTWNYQIVNCYGYANSEKSELWLLEHVTELTEDNEMGREIPWKVSDAPSEYINNLLNGIVGIKIDVSRIEGSLKMNQHHPKENRLGVIEGLSSSQKCHDHEVAALMQKLEDEKKMN